MIDTDPDPMWCEDEEAEEIQSIADLGSTVQEAISDGAVEKALIQQVQDKIDQVGRRLKSLTELRIKAEEAYMDKCPHELVLEAEAKSSDYHSHRPPFRSCRECGLAEEGWGTGYKKLKNEGNREIIPTTREVALRYKKKYIEQNR